MYYKPNRLIDVPSTDLLTWVFGNETVHDPDRPVAIPPLFPRPKKIDFPTTGQADFECRIAVH